MNWVVTLYSALLFFVLTPNVLLRLPTKGSVRVVALVHALVFALIFHFTHKLVWQASVSMSLPSAHAVAKKEGFNGAGKGAGKGGAGLGHGGAGPSAGPTGRGPV